MVAFGSKGTIANFTSATSSGAVGLPAGIAAGDVLILVWQSGAGLTVVPGNPAGWTLQASAGVGRPFLFVWSRIATGSDTSPTLTWSGAVSGSAQIVRYTGPVDPNGQGVFGPSSNANGSTSTHTSNGFFPNGIDGGASRDVYRIVLVECCASTTTLATPTGWTADAATAGSAAANGEFTFCSIAGNLDAATSSTGGAAGWDTFQLAIRVPFGPVASYARPLSEPIRRASDHASQTIGDGLMEAPFVPPPVSFTPLAWWPILPEPVRIRSNHAGQTTGDPLMELPAPVFQPFGWYRPLLEPTRRKSDHAGQTTGDPLMELPAPPFIPFGWLQPLSEPARRKVDASGQPQGYTFYSLNLNPPPVDYGPFFYAGLSEPVRRKSDHAGQPGGYFNPLDPMPPFQSFGWDMALSEPMRRKSDHALQPQGFFPTAAFQNFYPYGWFARLNEPTRRVSDHAGQPQGYFPALPMPPFLPFGWHMPLSEPVRRKSDHAGQPGGFYFPTVPVPVVFGSFFYGALAEPVRRKSDHAGQPGGIYFPPLPAPPLAPHGWFKPLNEPVRRKSDHALQPQGFFPPSKYFFIQPYIVTPVQGFTFPIPLFREITLHNLADQLNTLIDEINLALQGQGMCGGDPSVATVRQFVTALNQQGVWSALWTALLLLPVGDPAVMEFRAAQTMRKHGPLYEYAKAISGYSTIQMDVLWTLATGLTP